ncbi:hypothetical protein ASNO1_20280 [Corallococcus caeni]|uniref:Peptidase M10 metallopeptidase domain-containing protein n=2 Tax=Corallococcus caeni TaxID=3082388 RepID=A0ABQ6QP34_9BACT|nr:hypothetical protein ASNO1_20280 [Corallococcus sp. NO1]
MGFLPAATAGAYALLIIHPKWTDNPRIINVFTSQFNTQFGLDNMRTMGIVRSGLQSWMNVGVAFATVLSFEDTSSLSSDIEIEAKACCDGDCNAGCLGRTIITPFSDNCSLDIYNRTAHTSDYSDNRSKKFDFQSIFTHEFGHCMGLGHPPGNPPVVMTQDQFVAGQYTKRFPRDDDRLGGQYTQFIANYDVRVRNRTGGPWTVIGKTSGSVGVATRADGWSMVTFETDPDGDQKSHLADVAIDPSGAVGPTCMNYGDWTFDGVAISHDVGTSFAKAFRSSNDTGLIYVFRGVYPSLVGCVQGTSTLTNMASRRRPSLAFDAGTGRLVMTYIEFDTGQIKIATADSAGNWTSPVTLSTEWTDAPVGIDCGYWAPDGADRCFLAFPASDGRHQLRITKGYISSSGYFIEIGTQPVGGWTLNIAPDIQIVGGNRLEVLHGAADNTRAVNLYVHDCSGSTCVGSAFPLETRTYLGPGISSAKMVTAAP